VNILQKCPLRIPANIRVINAPNRQVHPTQLVGRLVALLPIDRYCRLVRPTRSGQASAAHRHSAKFP
jgi:hypothetical protein